jgi:DNA-binding transcriptional LysR family regulator
MYDRLLLKKGLSLEKLRNFVHVATAGGISKVTTDVIRQSLISRQIKQLERFFGVELIHRKGKTIQITAQGSKLAELTRLHLSALTDFSDDCRTQEVVFTIGAGGSILEWLLIPALNDINLEKKSIRLSLQSFSTAQLIKGVSECSIDFGIARTTAITAGLQHRSLGNLRYCLFIPRKLIPKRKSVDKDWIKEVPIATLASGQFHKSLLEATDRADISLRLNLLCSSFTQAAEAMKTGSYGAILPSIAAHSHLSNDIAKVELPWFSNEFRPLSLIWNPRMIELREKMLPLSEALSALLKNSLKASSP